MSADFLDQYGSRPSKGKKAAAIDVPFSEVADISEKVDKATNARSVKHGRYRQLTFRLDPEAIDDIRVWAERIGVSMEDMKRWLVARGVQALEKGERPLTSAVETKVIKLP